MADLTTAEACAELGITRYKLYNIARAKGIGANYLGRTGYRFTPADLDKVRAAMAPKPPVKMRRSA